MAGRSEGEPDVNDGAKTHAAPGPAPAPEAADASMQQHAGAAVDGVDGEGHGAEPRHAAHASQQPASKAAENSAILKLKGLPYSTTEQQVLEFFKDYRILSVRFVFEPDGRPSGLAFAEFQDKEEALRALSKNGEFIGERYVRLLHVPVTEMEEQVRLGTLAIPGNAAKLRSRLMRQQQQLQQRNRMAYLGPLHLVPAIIPSARPQLLGMGLALNHPSGIATQVPMEARGWTPAYGTAPQGAQAIPLQAQFQNLSGAGLAMAPGQVMHQHNPAMVPNILQPAAAQILHPAHAGQNPASATLKVRGLPYRSSPADILTFFQGYQYLPDSLQIGLDSLGRPSGEAWLTFVNPQEALRAVRDLNRHYLGNRYLELSIC